MNRPFTLTGAALTLLVLAAAPVCADPIYSYSWNVSSSVAVSNGGSISFSNFGSAAGVTGSTNTTAAFVSPMLPASGSGPFTITNGNYTATLSITDAASHTTGTLTFSGALGGSFTLTTSNTTDTILGVTDAGGFHSGVTTDLLSLGGTVYAVSYNGYVPPGGPPEGSKGPIGFNITAVSTAGGDPGTAGTGTPEPSSMVLAGLGAAVAGLAGGAGGEQRGWLPEPSTRRG